MALKPQSQAQRKLIDAATRAARHLPANVPPALFMTDPSRTTDPDIIAQRLPRGWGIIYRHFGADSRREIAEKLAKTARIRGLKLLISADPGLAKTVDAYGVHWPFHLADRAAYWRSTFPFMTVSAHSTVELAQTGRYEIDAVIYSTVFKSSSPSATTPIGADQFLATHGGSQRPIYALGGITSESVADISPAPFASVSGIADAFAPRT